MNKILVPYDFSEVARHALDFACEIAHKTDGEIVLVNVIEHPTADSFRTMGVQDIDPMEQVYIKKLIETVSEKLNSVLNEAGYQSEKMSYKIKIGNAYHNVIEEVTAEEADLIIAGTEGIEGLNEFFVGSIAEKVVRNASCPVITLQNKTEVEPIDRIVFASDFVHVDEVFIDKVKRLQTVLGATLKVVKINTPASFTSTRHDTQQMKDFVHKYDIENYTIDIYNYKNEEDGIIFYAEDVDADMIALGTHQRKGISHFFAYSIAEDVVNHSPIPVWTAHIGRAVS